jgi:hypothetical protein
MGTSRPGVAALAIAAALAELDDVAHEQLGGFRLAGPGFPTGAAPAHVWVPSALGRVNCRETDLITAHWLFPLRTMEW